MSEGKQEQDQLSALFSQRFKDRGGCADRRARSGEGTAASGQACKSN